MLYIHQYSFSIPAMPHLLEPHLTFIQNIYYDTLCNLHHPYRGLKPLHIHKYMLHACSVAEQCYLSHTSLQSSFIILKHAQYSTLHQQWTNTIVDTHQLIVAHVVLLHYEAPIQLLQFPLTFQTFTLTIHTEDYLASKCHIPAQLSNNVPIYLSHTSLNSSFIIVTLITPPFSNSFNHH